MFIDEISLDLNDDISFLLILLACISSFFFEENFVADKDDGDGEGDENEAPHQRSDHFDGDIGEVNESDGDEAENNFLE